MAYKLSKKEIVTEIVRSGKDPVYFINNYCRISHPMKGLISFNTYPYQDDLLRDFNDYRFTVILKARQLGISTITAAYCVWMMLFHRDKNVLVMATKFGTASNLVKKVKAMMKNLPPWIRISDIKVDNRSSFELGNGSQIKAIPTSDDAGRSEALSLLIIDEAQDLSSAQYKMAITAASLAGEVYIAGDDDQAIYKWAGADVNQFINLEGKLTYLKQSYRVPRKVHDVALRIVKRIGNRKEKVWEPRSLEGTVNRHVSFEHIDMSVGEWLVLARNNYLLTQVEEHLRKVGKVYEKNSKPSVSPILLNAILDWERLRKGERVQADKIRKIYGYMRAGKEVRRGFKTLKTAVGDEMLSIQDLKRVYGLMVDTIWHECFKLIGNTQREYLISCLRNNEKLSESKIRLNTIHASKGGESENVVILSDMARRSYDELYTNPDNECRTFYVGVTRTKNNLHLVNGKTRREFIF